MSRASRLAIAAGCAALLPACGLVGGGAPPPRTHGVVLVLASGLGAGNASHTPAFARLAAEGRRFEQAFAPDPDPARARAALLGEGEQALAARLRSKGVAVAGLAASEALAPATFDLSIAGSPAEPTVAERLEAWLRAQPRFVLVATIGPARAPLPPPATLAGAFAPPLPRIAVADLGFHDPPGGEVAPAAWSEPARQRAEASRLEHAIAADRELAALAAVVERSAAGTALIVVCDPPPDAGAHGRLERSDALFDERLRATVVVRTPGLARPGRASTRLVSTLDVVPTLFDLLGLAAEPDAESARSLMPLLASPSAAGRDAVVSSAPRKAGRLGRSVRSARFRFTEWPDGSRELYDHEADPGENRNLAGEAEHQSTLRDLQQELRARSVLAPRSPAAAEAPPREPVTALAPLAAAHARSGATTPSGGLVDARGAAARSRTAARAGAVRPRSVVLVVVDDLGTRVGAWGAPVKTPAIDRLAARGVRFERAYAQVAMCSPSRVSMLTGWRPDRTGIWQNEDPPRPRGAVPLQEHFAAHGAFTASIGKVYHSPADFRWDLREEHPDVVEERDPSAAGEGLAGLWVKAPGGDLDQPDGRRARRAAALVAGTARRPFFLALGLVRPHVRWVAPERYFGLYPPESIAPVPVLAGDLDDVPAIAVKTQPQPLPGLPLLGREPPGLVHDPAFLRRARAAYQACVSFADAQVGVVLDALDRHDLWKDTVVVLAGDNGFHLGEHGGLLRKDTLFEEALHVPLVVAAPGLRAGAVVRAPVELLDVYPTLVELAGIPAPEGLDGQSLVPLAQGRADSRGAARSWRRVQPPERGYSMRTEDLRYTLWPDGSEELYERRGKEPESENLAGRADWAARKKLLREALEQSVSSAH